MVWCALLQTNNNYYFLHIFHGLKDKKTADMSCMLHKGTPKIVLKNLIIVTSGILII